MARSWSVRAVGIEAFGKQESLVDSMQEYVQDFVEKMSRVSIDTNTGWVPRIIPIRPPARLSKGDRIAELEWRFQAGKIKYPRHRRHEWPMSALYEQTENFTRDLALLRFDDAIDCVGLSNYLLHTKGARRPKDPPKKSLLHELRTQTPAAPGLPLLSGMSGGNMTQEQVDTLLYNYFKDRCQKHGFMSRPRPSIITL